MQKLRLIPVCALVILMLLLAASACNKIGPAKGVVTVTDTTNFPLYNAIVYIHARDIIDSTNNKKTTIGDTVLTDASGKAAFEFKNEAIYTLDAIYFKVRTDSTGTPQYDTLVGKGIIKLERDKTVEAHVECK